MRMNWPISLVLGAMTCWAIIPALASFYDRQTNKRTWSALIGTGGLLLAIAALISPKGYAQSVILRTPFYLGVAPVEFRVDNLAFWFLGVIGLVSAAICPYLPGYMDHLKNRVDMRVFWAGFAALLLSMCGVVLASNVLAFLVAWEMMSISSFFLVGLDHKNQEVRNAALIYLGATRVGTAFLAGGFLWAHALTKSWTFSEWHLQGASALGPGILILIGLGVKAGVWPFHLWLPIAHPAAPSPISALMSGVMVKVAIYMMVRLFVLSNALLHPAFGYIVLAFGAMSAFWGVLFALLQHDLKRLLAYHTVENIGLILMGVGGAIICRSLGLRSIARIALAAALFHVLNHAVFKSLLFLGAGAIDQSTGTRDLEHLGGLGKSMKVTFACFVVGSAAICALPPLNGFASEWLLYQSALGIASSVTPPYVRFMSMLLIGWIALVGALALACFVKATGVAFLGRPRSSALESAKEAPTGMQIGQISLACLCIVLGLSAPGILGFLHNIVKPLQVDGQALSSVWTLPMGALVLVLSATVLCGVMWMKRASQKEPTREFVTWECGFGALTPRMQVTATSFAQPIARMFGAIFRYAINLHIDGANRRLFPEEIEVKSTTEAVLESRVYSPFIRWIDRAGGWVVRLQTGSIHLYLLTMFATLFALLLIGGYVT